MQTTAIAVDHIPPLEHDEAMRLAQTEYQHLIKLVDQLTPENWTRPTDCTGWDVTAVLAHVLGMLERNARIVADVVAEWTRRHGQPCTLILDGPAGGIYRNGEGGPQLQCDAVQFCRAVSGRGTAEGLLAHQVPF